MAELGVIPKEAAKTIWAKGKDAPFDVARIDEIEREVKHDVIAFPTHLAEFVGPEARFVHQGMTSSDVLDTCFNVQLAARRRPADRRHRQGAGGAEEARLRAQDDADHRPLAWHPRRAGDVRPETRLRLRGIFARPRAPRCRAQGSRDLRDLGRGRHVRADRSARRGTRRQGDGACRRAGLDAGDPARPPRDVLCHARRHRRLGRTARHRNPASAAHRGAGGRGVLLRGPEGLLRDAAQAQPGADGKSLRPCPAWCAPM